VLWEPAPGIAPPRTPVPAVAVAELSRHAGTIAARFFGHPSRALHCVGVTGTDGKTSTAYLLAQALERLRQPCLYIGTLGTGRPGALVAGDHTTPDPVGLQRRLHAALNDGAACVAMEVSSHALDQARVAGVEFATAILTNVGRDHLDYHGTVERYAAAKRRLFLEAAPRAVVLNGDDAHGRAWAAELAGHPWRIVYALDGAADLRGTALALSPDGLSLEVAYAGARATIASRLLGRFNACNLLAALGALLARNVGLHDACAALGAATTVPGRIEGFRGPKAAPLVVVDYAHTPQALAQVLQAARSHCRATMWCVFGCGGDRDRGKRPLMGEAAARLADRVIVTDDNPRTEDPAAIVAEILAGMPAGRARVIHDREQAITAAVRAAGPDDVVVVAGKGHEDYQVYGRERRAFSDRAFVAGLVGQA
jgi:UDP-N-acetylmuramoyl-L-alanyl-D-glutamate--2,6-diaminopimelate ligase